MPLLRFIPETTNVDFVKYRCVGLWRSTGC